MSGVRAGVVVGLGCVLLAGCGTPTSPAPVVSHADSAVTITAEPAGCATTVDGTLCTVRVWYTNTSNESVAVDAAGTKLIDSSGHSSTPQMSGDARSSWLVPAGDRFAVTWQVPLPSDATVTAVLWRASGGQTETAPLVMAFTGENPSDSASPSLDTPSPSASATTPTPTPKPVVKPAKPKPTVATRPPSSGGGGGGGGGGGSTKPPATGTIG